MSISSLLNRNLTQTCIYWGNPANDGYGGLDFDNPVELLCRWEDKTVLQQDAKGNQITSDAVVFVLQDVEEGGYLYLGSISDLDSSAVSPVETAKAFQIITYEKVPALKGSEYFRAVYLKKK